MYSNGAVRVGARGRGTWSSHKTWPECDPRGHREWYAVAEREGTCTFASSAWSRQLDELRRSSLADREHPVRHQRMVMEVHVQPRSEALAERDGPDPGSRRRAASCSLWLSTAADGRADVRASPKSTNWASATLRRCSDVHFSTKAMLGDCFFVRANVGPTFGRCFYAKIAVSRRFASLGRSFLNASNARTLLFRSRERWSNVRTLILPKN